MKLMMIHESVGNGRPNEIKCACCDCMWNNILPVEKESNLQFCVCGMVSVNGNTTEMTNYLIIVLTNKTLNHCPHSPWWKGERFHSDSKKWDKTYWSFLVFSLVSGIWSLKYPLKIYSETCLQRPLRLSVLKHHIFPVEGPAFQCNWTCHQGPPVLRDHICMAKEVVFQDRFYPSTVYIHCVPMWTCDDIFNV